MFAEEFLYESQESARSRVIRVRNPAATEWSVDLRLATDDLRSYPLEPTLIVIAIAMIHPGAQELDQVKFAAGLAVANFAAMLHSGVLCRRHGQLLISVGAFTSAEYWRVPEKGRTSSENC